MNNKCLLYLTHLKKQEITSLKVILKKDEIIFFNNIVQSYDIDEKNIKKQGIIEN